MPTPYEKIFNSFLGKIEDDLYTSLTTEDAETDLIKLLNSAIIHFDFPKVNIFDKDDTTKTFAENLNLHEIEILATLMKAEWIKRQINNVNLLRQMLGSKDFALTSQANHLKSLVELKSETDKDVEKLLTKYSYTANRESLYDGLSGDS